MIQAITDLRALGYSPELVEGRIKLTWKGEGQPDKDEVFSLLDTLKRNKTEVMQLLEAEQVKTKPYLDAEGDLVIPWNSDPKYHWWNGGQSISETLRELKQKENVKKEK